MQSFVASSLALMVVVVVVVAWGAVGTDAHPQTQSITDTVTTSFNAAAGATEDAIDSASSFLDR